MNIKQSLIDTLNERADVIGKLVTRRTELENDIKSGRFSAAAVAEMQAQLHHRLAAPGRAEPGRIDRRLQAVERRRHPECAGRSIHA